LKTKYKTERLLLRELSTDDADFIFELVNTDGWIKFIGDRNIKSGEDANLYIQKILANTDISYRVVTLPNQKTAIGIVTVIKRDYLEYHDIGFAFLPAYTGRGFAFEATLAVLTNLLVSGEHTVVLATTIKENSSSVNLLQKLGFSFSREVNSEKDKLQLFSITKDKLFNPG
jgi:RimJ/RimL family protein N-acetyltransferase